MSDPNAMLALCPGCGADMDGGAIPEEIIEHYHPGAHWWRWIGRVDMEKDRVMAWLCPDCGYERPRS